MGKNEKDLLNELQLYFTSIGSRLFRNNVARSWVGTKYSRDKNILIIENPRPIHSGLATGSSDLIGWHSITITEEMVGKKIAVFTGIEVKTGRLKPTDEQSNFCNLINDSGGIGIIARSLDDIKSKLK